MFATRGTIRPKILCGRYRDFAVLASRVGQGWRGRASCAKSPIASRDVDPTDGRSGAWTEQAQVDEARVFEVPSEVELSVASVMPVATLTPGR
jgi:NADPH:quinone reductase-like Zn-dependent oxidoreductase